MDINISSKLLENIIGKIDRFGLAKIIKTGQVLRGRVLALNGDLLVVDFGKGPVMAKTQVKLQKGDFIKVIIKDVKNDTLILKLLEKKEGIIEKDIEREILSKFPQIDKEKAKIAKSLVKQNIPITDKNIDTLKKIIEKEVKLKELLERLSYTEKKEETKGIRERIKDLIKELSQGYLIEKEDHYELIFIFPYIDEKLELMFQKIRMRYKKRKGEGEREEEEKIEFSLSMSKLGPLKIDMSFKKNIVDAEFFSRKEDVNFYIEKNIEKLKKALFRINFILNKVRFGILEINKKETEHKKIIKGIDIKI